MDDDYKMRQHVNRAIGAAYPLLREISDEIADGWFGRVVSDVTLLTMPDEIQFVDVLAREDSDRPSIDITITVVTDTMIVTVTGDPDRGESSRSTVARARADLTQLEVRAGMDAFDNRLAPGSSAWPGRTSLVLTFADGYRIELPSDRTSYTERDKIPALIAGLRADLIASGSS